MKAYHGDKAVKAKYLKRIRGHMKAETLIRGKGWTGEKGCAVGCTLENYNHTQYPEWLARLEDTLFENVGLEYSKTFPEKFLKAINTGSNLEKVKVPFLCFILRSSLDSMESTVFDREANPAVVKAIEGSKAAVLQMIEALEQGRDLTAARSAARSAAESSWSAESAARSAAWSAAWSSWSAESAAWSAARSAESAESAAWSAAHEKYADYLLELLKQCK